ncbi:MAG: hypothetical protein QM809_17900 [Gordonia sp. (in: high G+C Gram-positive bacteria)]|uniref:hypothetical protein n=1 Tax=Gordonia sp. (in: high G+C Gram-positive bacteria) TaxID=84139 RepID=UPI0039E55106
MSSRSSRRVGPVVVAVAVLAASGCGSSSNDAVSTVTVTAAPSTVTRMPSQETVENPSAPPESAATPSDDAAGQGSSKKAVMPDVLCMNLQAAQNKVQESGVFFSRSEDATGKARQQVWDRNWIVVGQRPAAGTRIGEGDAVLSVVKYGEPNQCPNG